VRVLLDENVPHDLIERLIGHETLTVQRLGWSGTHNGLLLERAKGTADALITMDRRLEREHDLTRMPFAVVILVARSSRMIDLLPLVGELCTALNAAKPGQVIRVGS